jgi:hypothetical protein
MGVNLTLMRSKKMTEYQLFLVFAVFIAAIFFAGLAISVIQE